MYELIPEPRPEEFVNSIKNKYTEARWSSVNPDPDFFQNFNELRLFHAVSVTSGEYPAFSRFVKDIKKFLYKHGYVVSETKKDHFIGLKAQRRSMQEVKIWQQTLLQFSNPALVRARPD